MTQEWKVNVLEKIKHGAKRRRLNKINDDQL